MPIDAPFGRMDLKRLIDDSSGTISFELFDSGTFQKGQGRYQATETVSGKCQVSALDANGNVVASVEVENPVLLTPRLVAFIGLYIGDGAKSGGAGSGLISFSQSEPNLVNFVRAQFIELFGQSLSFTHRVNEDALFFMTDEMRSALRKFRDFLRSRGDSIPTEAELKTQVKQSLDQIFETLPGPTQASLRKYREKKNLIERYEKHLVELLVHRPFIQRYMETKKRQELIDSGVPLGPSDRISVNIRLPGVKGARQEGQSSRSDELDVNNFAPFRSLFLFLMHTIEISIATNQTTISVPGSTVPWLIWNGPPRETSAFTLDVKKYIATSPSAQLVSSKKVKQRFEIMESLDRALQLRFGPKRRPFAVHRVIPLTPLVSLYLGLYLAEGGTKKWKIFSFPLMPVTGLTLSFSGSEPTTFEITMNAMHQLLPGEEGKVCYWRLKVGSKYFFETTTVGDKLGAFLLRRGESGQGAASGFETIDTLKQWALQAFPPLTQVADRFDHLEFTGAGVPRVDIFYPNFTALFLFALMRDLISAPAALNAAEATGGTP